MRERSGRAPRVGLFGGTFDPVHKGHLRAASAAVGRFGLERMHFIPSAIPPHKRATDMASAEDRMAMVELAVRGRRRFVPSPIEVRAGATSYSVVTLDEFRREAPGARHFFLLGVDAFCEIETWREWRRLLDLCRLIVVARPGAPLAAARRAVEPSLRSAFAEVGPSVRLGEAFLEAHRIFLFPIDALPVSSTEIRRRVRDGLPIRGLVPPAVECYIHRENLYRRPSSGKES
ncbi:MAG: nicotinate (nicotinamide) nucleotide adenylyltransferase [Candidatus Aminicenantes bacterium]|nr:nicotinate (nicotinamide) nucleotide adenylyltransferase [Candidatus Aminicenantes bacterium]